MTIPSSTVASPGEHKVPGVQWDMTKDQLIIDLAHLVEGARRLEPTKRNVVIVIGQIYDPLGYVAPMTIIINVAESLTPRYTLMPHVCFSESQVALCWINRIDKDWKQFVQNRVEIG